MINEELDRLLELDPVKNHQRIMEMTRPPPVVIHKEYTGKQPSLPDNGEQLLFSDEQIDTIAQALAELRADLRDEWQAAIDKAITELRGEKDLHEAIAELRGQLAVVMNLFGNGPKLFEAEQTVRKLKVSAGEGGT
jgi:hypothetical protein